MLRMHPNTELHAYPYSCTLSHYLSHLFNLLKVYCHKVKGPFQSMFHFVFKGISATLDSEEIGR